MLTVLTFVVLSLVLTQSTAGEVRDLFYGKSGCLVVNQTQPLSPQDRLLILAPTIPPFETQIRSVVPPGNSPECGREFTELQDHEKSLAPSLVASFAVPRELRSTPVFAVRTRSTLLVHAGPRIALSAEVSAQWARRVGSSLDAAWRAPDVLVQAYGYGKGNDAVELYLGRATGPLNSSGGIQAITVQRFFIIDGKVLAGERFDRVSGREERVDTAPPILTRESWSRSDTEKTIAFLSDDGGRSWKRLSTNAGYEGIWWIVQTLSPGLPRTLERYVYTAPN